MIRDFKVSALGMEMDNRRVVVRISVGTRFLFFPETSRLGLMRTLRPVQ